jgi:hypothetical protein
LAAVLFNLSGIREAERDLEEAESCLVQCCEIEESKVPDCATLSHLVTWNKLGEIRLARENKAGAKECFVKCLAMTRVLVGEAHPATQQLLELLKQIS